MTQSTLTEQLRAWHDGDTQAFQTIIETQYYQLKNLGRHLLAKDRLGRQIQPTELINLAFSSLCQKQSISWADRRHFFGVAVRTMRRCLIQEARRLGAAKRGAAWAHVSLEDNTTPHHACSAETLLLVDEALKNLANLDPMVAQVVELRFFGGFSVAQAAEILDVSEPTINRKWRFAKAWLSNALTHG